MRIIYFALFLVATCSAQDISLPVEPSAPSIYYLHITSDIRYRFSTTTVTSKLANEDARAAEATFTIDVPEQGFITNFTMLIEDQLIVGEVKEKVEAKQQYQDATRRGESAGIIRAVPRGTNRFTISVNVAPLSKVTFTLTYSEILQRSLGTYSHVINLKPNQVVKSFLIDVYINETSELTIVKVPPIADDISKQHLTLQQIDELQENVRIEFGEQRKTCHISYAPSVESQNAVDPNAGINGQFAVFYDVERKADGGEILVYNGYFIHFFAPDVKDQLEVLNKRIAFVLDTSGSMGGIKIGQLKSAMTQILSELTEGDLFNVIEFNSDAREWRPTLQSTGTSSQAKEFVNRLHASGGTNIDAALSAGLSMLLRTSSGVSSKLLNAIFFLTDGQPTVGVTDITTILSNVEKENLEADANIYTLGFGRGADITFLQQMAEQNSGVARKIYEDSDAALQVAGFYKEISSPLLSNLSITYLNKDESTPVQNIIRPSCLAQGKSSQHLDDGVYYSGDEFLVAGCLRSPHSSVTADISGSGVTYDLRTTVDAVPEDVAELGERIEKMWAYLTIKKLLKEMDKAKENRNEIRERALALSLKYNFVTRLTSMVVTLPEVSTTTTRSSIPIGSPPPFLRPQGPTIFQLGQVPVGSPSSARFSSVSGFVPQSFQPAGRGSGFQLLGSTTGLGGHQQRGGALFGAPQGSFQGAVFRTATTTTTPVPTTTTPTTTTTPVPTTTTTTTLAPTSPSVACSVLPQHLAQSSDVLLHSESSVPGGTLSITGTYSSVWPSHLISLLFRHSSPTYFLTVSPSQVDTFTVSEGRVSYPWPGSSHMQISLGAITLHTNVEGRIIIDLTDSGNRFIIIRSRSNEFDTDFNCLAFSRM